MMPLAGIQNSPIPLNASARIDVASAPGDSSSSKSEYREVFDDFVGQTFYQQMFKSMRDTVGKPAYFHGGRAEEVFQSQLDQTLADKMSEATAHSFTGPMFDLMTLPRR